jgi:hypothetical protein
LQIPKAKLIFLIILFTISACVGDPIAGMERFKYHKDRAVSERDNINDWLNPRAAVVARDVQEVRPGVMEYSFEPKHSWEVECKFILVVEKDTGTVIGWRYNGKPENCQDAR